MQEKEIIQELKNQVTNKQLLPTGHGIFDLNGNPVVLFNKKLDDDSGDVYLATPEGVLLMSAGNLFDWTQEKTKEIYLENLAKMLKSKKAVQSLPTKH